MKKVIFGTALALCSAVIMFSCEKTVIKPKSATAPQALKLAANIEDGTDRTVNKDVIAGFQMSATPGYYCGTLSCGTSSSSLLRNNMFTIDNTTHTNYPDVTYTFYALDLTQTTTGEETYSPIDQFRCNQPTVSYASFNIPDNRKILVLGSVYASHWTVPSTVPTEKLYRNIANGTLSGNTGNGTWNYTTAYSEGHRGKLCSGGTGPVVDIRRVQGLIDNILP